MPMPKPPALKFEPLANLKAAAINPRTHSDEQVRQLAQAIAKFGWTVPVLYDYRANEIVAGHGRAAAAARLYESGATIFLAPGEANDGPALPAGSVPVLDVTGWSQEERRAYLLADNALAEQAGWDYDLLGGELRDLQLAGFDLDLLGFSSSQLDEYLRPDTREGDVDTPPEPPARAVSRTGDMWQLGRHRILCGDATSRADVERLLEGGADLTVTDPPYGIGYSYASHDDRDNEENAKLVGQVFHLAPLPKVWTPGLNNLARDISRFGETKVAFWHKGFAAAGNGMGGASTVEPILVMDPPRRNLANNYLRIGTDRAEVQGQSLGDLHPCPKPVELYEVLLRSFSDRGQVVYEPFAGSGTTLIAAERTGRDCRAMEIDPRYVDVVLQRWQELTGQSATLDGSPFADVQQVRLEPAGVQE